MGLRSDRSGSIAAEFALIVPLLLLLSFGIIEFGRVMWVRNALQSAVEDAARCYALKQPACDTAGKIQSYTIAAAAGVSVTQVVSGEAPGEAGELCYGRWVRASSDFISLVPIIPLDYTISARACRPTPP